MYREYLLSALFVGLALCGYATQLQAQTSDDRWRSLNTIKPGARLVVERDGLEPLKAKFAEATDQSIALTSKGKRIEIPRDAVSAVYLGRRSSKVRRGVIGALAGAGAGMLIGAVTIAATKGDPVIAAGGFLYGIPIGAAIGVATAGGTKKGELLYSR